MADENATTATEQESDAPLQSGEAGNEEIDVQFDVSVNPEASIGAFYRVVPKKDTTTISSVGVTFRTVDHRGVQLDSLSGGSCNSKGMKQASGVGSLDHDLITTQPGLPQAVLSGLLDTEEGIAAFFFAKPVPFE